MDQIKRINGRGPEAVGHQQEQTGPGLYKWVLVALAVAAVLELLLWRTFSRVGLFIPKQGTFQDIYRVITQIGVVLLNFAVVLAVGLAGLSVGQLRAAGRLGERGAKSGPAPLMLACTAIVMVLGLTFIQLALVQNAILSLFLRLTLLAGFGALVVDYWRQQTGWQARLFIGLLAAATTLQLLAKFLHDELAILFNFHELDNLYLPLLLAGEGLVLLNGFGTYLRYGGGGTRPAASMARHWPALAGAVALVALFVAVTVLTGNVAQSAIVPILALYALGYTMQLPLVLYVIALFFLVYSLFYNLSHLGEGPEYRAAVFGLILVFTGGYVFNISNQYIFALLGVLLLARPELVENW